MRAASEAPYVQTGCQLIQREIPSLVPSGTEQQFRNLIETVRDAWRNGEEMSTYNAEAWLPIRAWVLTFDSLWEQQGFESALREQVRTKADLFQTIKERCRDWNFLSENDQFSSAALGLPQPRR